MTLRKKIAIYLYKQFLLNRKIGLHRERKPIQAYWYAKADAILSLFKQVCEEAKPKEEHGYSSPDSCEECCYAEGINDGISDYHSALMEKLK